MAQLSEALAPAEASGRRAPTLAGGESLGKALGLWPPACEAGNERFARGESLAVSGWAEMQ